MFKDLIKYDELLEASNEMFGFENAEFLRPFGPWKRGDKVYSLWFDLETTNVTAYNDNNVITDICRFQLTALI